MSKLFRGVLVTALALAGAFLFPGAAGAANSGAVLCRVETSTPTLVAVVCEAGTSAAPASGVIFEVSHSSGATGDECFVGDTYTTPSANTSQANGFDTQGIKASPNILTSGASTACTSTSNCGSWKPSYGGRYSKQLIVMRKGTSNCLVWYLPSSQLDTLPKQ